MNAEFGFRNAGVLDIQTKGGSDKKFSNALKLWLEVMILLPPIIKLVALEN